MRNQFNVFVRRLCNKFSEKTAMMKGFSGEGFTEEKLCEGLCSTKTLRNLQNGSRNLDKNILQALFEEALNLTVPSLAEKNLMDLFQNKF